MELQKMVTKLVTNIKEVERLSKEIEELREALKQATKIGWQTEYDGYIVKHASVRKTITDPEKLKEIGIDPDKVTVTITKIDTNLVRILGQKENKEYYTIEDRIVCEKQEK